MAKLIVPACKSLKVHAPVVAKVLASTLLAKIWKKSSATPALGPDADTCWRAKLQLDKDRLEVQRSTIFVSVPSQYQSPRLCRWQHVLAWELEAPGCCDGQRRLSNNPVSVPHADERFMALGAGRRVVGAVLNGYRDGDDGLSQLLQVGPCGIFSISI